ncbi:dachshund homolog 2-like isoform X2 [Coregonus clupeaformis]|uniref:dachshund homolog 2-like isoform X2 n=1 Tax=Coregonus clupeaformis TaxID=59861 RepID=UPI001E1C70F2|nr:dachshund homolog 2-like isoform X2 [Coregonus clupeaformis]
MTTTTVVSATPPVLSPGPGVPSSGGIFPSDPFYTPTTTSPHQDSPSLRLTTTGLLNPFLSGSGVPSCGLGFNNTPVFGDRVISTTTAATTTSECRMVAVHGVKVASFSVGGQDELICLPQVFDLFLKHLVGGLHTVYTKLKRLDICPVVCTVEQVRVLRGLGAIQPGVNRCKLISRRDFEALYNDCTNASSRPGRPPKRSVGGGIQESSSLHGLLSPGMLSHTAAAMAELQKMKMMMMQGCGANGHNGNKSDNEDMPSNTGGNECSWDKERRVSLPSGGGGVGGTGLGGQQRLNIQMNSLQQQLLVNRLQDLPFMMMPHPLLPVRLPPASVAMAMSQMNHLNTIANMAAAAHIYTHTHRAPVIKERVCDSQSPSPSLEDTHTPLLSQHSSHLSSTTSPDPLNHDTDLTERDILVHIQKMAREKDSSFDRLSSGQALPPGFPAPFLFAAGISSAETLLTNIQGLLKVAVENASVQDKQIQAEKRELKMELYRERELRESLERQLASELQSRASIQKRLKKERKLKRKLQEMLAFESKRRERVEDALKHWSSSSLSTPDTRYTSSNDMEVPEEQPELNGNQHDNPTVQESCAFLKTPPAVLINSP